MANILLLGATSAIVQSTARRFAEAGERLYLVARDAQRLEIVAQDLKARGAQAVEYTVADLADHQAHEPLVAKVWNTLGEVDVCLLGYGTLPDQARAQHDMSYAREQFNINATSAISVLSLIADRMEQQGRGCIAGISSVAGDRGRKSNYLYGSAKAALSIFLAGLRNRLASTNVAVVTIKPGFVDTPMTREFDKGLLWASADYVGGQIYKAIGKRRDVVYVPWFWRFIMLIIRSIPERIFKRMSL